MSAHLPEPIAGIRGIGFNPVNDGVPVASFMRRNILSDLVARFPVPGDQQESAKRGFGIARMRKELFRTGGHEVARQFLRKEFGGGQRNGLARVGFENRDGKRVKMGRVPEHDPIFARRG